MKILKMMRKVLFLLLLLTGLGAAGAKAQVTIGDQVTPDGYSLLDLVTTKVQKGLHLPRLTTTQRNLLIPATVADSAAAVGLAVFNTDSKCYDVWNGKKWLSLCDATVNPLRITGQPAPFTWQRMQDATADPNGPVATAVTLSVAATGSGTLTYAWYEKPKNTNVTVRGTKLATTASYTTPAPAWGMHTYYCVVSNETDSVVSNFADVAYGCGAKTTDDRWISFMCYNLGADPSLDPFTYTSINDTTSFDSKGWMFQWGRVADGHQWRSSATVAGPWDGSVADQVPVGDAHYGFFITTAARATFYDWRTPQQGTLWYSNRTVYDPCPAGWLLPTQTDFSSIISANALSVLNPVDATANTWTWTTGGFQVQPDGSTTTLFLPAAGSRYNGGGFNWIGSGGYYWTSTSNATYNFMLLFGTTALTPGSITPRSNGRSVRCVANH